MKIKALNFAQMFCQEYYINKNTNKVLDMISDNVIWSFSNNPNTAFNKEEAKKIIEKNIDIVNIDSIEYLKKETTFIDNNIVGVYLELKTKKSFNSKIFAIKKLALLISTSNNNIVINNIHVTEFDDVLEESKNKTNLNLDYKKVLEKLDSGFIVYKVVKDNIPESVYFSDGFCKMVEGKPEEVYETYSGNAYSCVHPDDLEYLYNEYNNEIVKNINYSKKIKLTYRIKKINGEYFWITNTPIVISRDEELTYAFGIINDINDIKTKELMLTESEAKLYTINEHSKLYFWEYDLQKGFMIPGSKMIKDFKLPEELSNFPYSFIEKGLVGEEYVNEFIQMNLDIKAGLPSLEKLIKLNYFGNEVWFSVKYITIFDDKNRAITSFATAENMDAYKDLEDKFFIATASEGIITWTYDVKTKTIYQTDRMVKMFGGSTVISDAPTILSSSHSIHPDDVDAYLKFYEEVNKAQETKTIRVRKLDIRTNKYVWYKVTYTPIFDKLGRLYKVIGSASNITHLVESEERYLTFKNYQRIINDKTMLLLNMNLISNVCSKIEIGSKSIEESNIYTVEEILENIYSNIVLTEDKERYQKVLTKEYLISHYNNGETVISFECRYKHNSKKHWVKISITMMENPATKDIEALVYITNIDKERNIASIINSLARVDYDFIGVIDIKARTIETYGFNDRTEYNVHNNIEIYSTINEQNIRLMISDKEIQEDAIKKTSIKEIVKILEDRKSYVLSYPTIDKLGKKCYTRWKFFYNDESKETILFTLIDVTEMYEEEERKKILLEAALLKAKSASIAKSDFMSRMSHDMRTPMNGIIGLINLTKKENISNKTRENLDKMEAASQYLLSLINDTLDMNKIESEKLVLNYDVVNAADFLEKVLFSIRTTIELKNIHFSVNYINVDFMKDIKLDKVRVQQILTNILSNAVKFTPENGKIDFTLECLDTDKYAHLKVSIKDSGIGMDEKFLAHIFEPFSQEHNDINVSNVGTGLGMSIVKNLVTLMNGRIKINSKKGEGTEVIVWLDFELATEKIKKEVLEENLDILANKRILLFEDHPLNAEIATLILEEKKCIVDLAVNGKEGYDILVRNGEGYYDIILMDIRMPVMNGIEATQAIRKINKPYFNNIPIIAMSANAFEEDIKETKKVGMDDYLTKPVQPNILYSTLAKWLSNK